MGGRVLMEGLFFKLHIVCAAAQEVAHGPGILYDTILPGRSTVKIAVRAFF